MRLTYNDSVSAPSLNNAWCVAASGDTIHVVWHDTRDGNYEIYTKRSTDSGMTWSPDTRLTNNIANSWFPSVAVLGSNVHVVWEDYRDGNWEIYTMRSSDGGASWGSDTRLTNNSAISEYQSVAASGSNVHVVWQDWRDGNSEIYTKRSSDGGGSWGADVRLTNNIANSEYPSVAVSGSDVHVVWEDDRDGNSEIYTKRSSDGGLSWGPDTRLTNDTAVSWYPSVAVLGSDVHVVWYDMRDGNWEIYYKCSTDGGSSWSPDTRLTNNSAWSGYPSVAASGSNVHVVWCDTRDGNPEIYYKRSSDWGLSWSLDTRLTNNNQDSGYPSVAASGSKVHVVWKDFRDRNWEIYYKRNPIGNSGVEVVSGPQSTVYSLQSRAIPNPFVSFTSVPGHSSERFALYDISGRKVGVYQGDRIGADLGPGVYFLKPEGKESRPVRIVKVR